MGLSFEIVGFIDRRGYGALAEWGRKRQYFDTNEGFSISDGRGPDRAPYGGRLEPKLALYSMEMVRKELVSPDLTEETPSVRMTVSPLLANFLDFKNPTAWSCHLWGGSLTRTG